MSTYIIVGYENSNSGGLYNYLGGLSLEETITKTYPSSIIF